jgi:2-polyprenyl-6-methoxyphenol hydroxylase-like FAD-dependent oxidoreductase
MIHNIPQPVLEQELTNYIDNDPNITLLKGFSIHAVKQVSRLSLTATTQIKE